MARSKVIWSVIRLKQVIDDLIQVGISADSYFDHFYADAYYHFDWLRSKIDGDGEL